MTEFWINVAALVGGFVVLIYSADRFVLGSASLARNLGISPLVIGLTVVGFGTSAPELLVSSIAAWQGDTGLAVGNALGSNILNIGLILGCTALIAPIVIHSRALRWEMPILLIVCLLAYGLSFDERFERWEGATLLLGLVVFLIWLVWQARQTPPGDLLAQELESELPPSVSMVMAWLWIVLGLLGLLLSSRAVVWGAVGLARYFGISDLIIGLTIVALGTSLPELASSIAGIIKGEDDLVIGNIVGSNIFNLLAVYGLAGLIQPDWLEREVVTRDFPWMLGFTVALLLLGLGRRNPSRIGWLGGVLLLAGFSAYQYLLYLDLSS